VSSTNRCILATIIVVAVLSMGCAGAGGAMGDIDANTGGSHIDAGAPPPPPGTPDAGVVILPDAAPPPPGTPDAAPPPPPPGMCNLVTSAGCSAPTPACDLAAANAHQCRAVTTPGMTTSTCNDATACAAGYSCIGASATAASCLRYCGADSDCGGGVGALCVVTLVDGAMLPIPGVKLCSQSCAPLDSSGCPTTWGCRLALEQGGAMRGYTTCEPTGSAGNHGSCTSDASCQAGFQCICSDANCTGPKQCRKLCNATDNLGCSAGQACTGLGVVIGGKAWGICP